MLLPWSRCKWDHIPKSIVWIVFNSKCEKEREEEIEKQSGKRGRDWGRDSLSRKHRQSLNPSSVLLILFWSSQCWVSCLLGMFGTVSCNSLWICCIICHHMQSSGMSLGMLWVSLMVYDTSSAAFLINVLCVCGLPMVEGFTGDSVCVRQDGCSLPLTSGYTTHQKTFLLPPCLGRSVCKPGISKWVYGL